MAVRPKTAASLIAIWHDSLGTPHLLMGRRHASLRFLPGFLVFPGGRFETRDRTSTQTASLDAASTNALNTESSVGASALLNTALRETIEETGIDIAAQSHRPASYVARAVTPPSLPVRYDTHFFRVVVATAKAPPCGTTPVDGELLAVDWFAAPHLHTEPLHHVTAAVARHAIASLSHNKLDRLLIANRRPRRWTGLPPLRSAALKASGHGQEDGA